MKMKLVSFISILCAAIPAYSADLPQSSNDSNVSFTITVDGADYFSGQAALKTFLGALDYLQNKTNFEINVESENSGKVSLGGIIRARDKYIIENGIITNDMHRKHFTDVPELRDYEGMNGITKHKKNTKLSETFKIEYPHNEQTSTKLTLTINDLTAANKFLAKLKK